MFFCFVCDTILTDRSDKLSPQVYAKRISAIKLADTLNKIEGAPVSEYARELSDKWAKGEITGQQMKKALIDKHKTKK